MTLEPKRFENDAVDEWVGEWLDSERTDASSDESAGSSPSLDSNQVRHAADLQLVHSLLTQLADRDKAAEERQIQKLMNHIAQDKTSDVLQKGISQKIHRFIRPLVRYGIAAAIVIVFFLIFLEIPTNTALASIDQMIAAIDRAGDRTYSIRVEDTGKSPRRPPPDRQPDRKRESGERAGLDGATLYFRDGDKFVLCRQTPSGKTVINGSDGQTRWLIRPEKPVLVSNNSDAFRIPMPEEMAAILSLDFKATLQHIRDYYKVKTLENVPDRRPEDVHRIYLDAVKVNHDFRGPKNIEIWADQETGLLLRIEFADIHLQSDPSPKRLIIELVNQDRLAENWFTHQAHHSPDIEIDYLSE